MTDNAEPADNPNAQAPTRDVAAGNFSLQRCYLKDVSFEAPNTPAIFLKEWQPKVDVQMNNGIAALGSDVYECTLSVRVTATVEDQVAFLVEVEQAGIFTIAGFNDEEKDYVHGTMCPATLYPYAREAVSDLVTKGSFPQFLLAPINFEYLYRTNKKQKAAQLKAAAAAEASGG